jgi:predicted  nucleic acid-binding Zn-ribbon protein
MYHESTVRKPKQLLNAARARIDTARTKLAEAKNSVEGLLVQENSKEVFESARNTVKSVATHIKEAHGALVDSIIALKGNIPPKSRNINNEESAVE